MCLTSSIQQPRDLTSKLAVSGQPAGRRSHQMVDNTEEMQVHGVQESFLLTAACRQCLPLRSRRIRDYFWHFFNRKQEKM